MHPLLASRLKLLLYVAVWLGVGALLVTLFVLIHPRPLAHAIAFAAPLTLEYAFTCLSAWWLCRSLPIGSTPTTVLATRLATATLISAGLLVLLGALWGTALARLTHTVPDAAVTRGDLMVLAVTGVVLYAQSIAAYYAILAFEAAGAAERRILETQVGAREAELRALRAQLNPHFLYNSLNSISALTGSDPESARRMCQLLGEFLRESLALGARERVALLEELDLAERYLAIEQVRFGPRLGVERSVERAAERCQVPPLLLQPLVENAVKHGVADRVEGGTVKISARRRAGRLEVTVENPRDPDAPPRRGSGRGLDNVRRRLEALDPREARVEVTRDAERFRVEVVLPAVEPTSEAHDGA